MVYEEQPIEQARSLYVRGPDHFVADFMPYRVSNVAAVKPRPAVIQLMLGLVHTHSRRSFTCKRVGDENPRVCPADTPSFSVQLRLLSLGVTVWLSTTGSIAR